MEVAAITGLAAEARIARRHGLEAVATGGIEAQVLEAAERLINEGAEALVSFGIAGALAPDLAPGSLLLPRAVLAEDGSRLAVDEARRARADAALAASGLRAASGHVLGASEPAATPARKAALRAATGAIAIDLESHLVARVASRAGKPFLVLRAVADPASRALPEAALIGLDADGKPALGRVLLSVMRNPRQIPALLRLAGDTRRALLALGSALAARPL
jgi:adenosylhomocysteine nucleosidase